MVKNKGDSHHLILSASHWAKYVLCQQHPMAFFLYQLCARNVRLREAEKHALGLWQAGTGTNTWQTTKWAQDAEGAQIGESPFQTLHRHTQSRVSLLLAVFTCKSPCAERSWGQTTQA